MTERIVRLAPGKKTALFAVALVFLLLPAAAVKFLRSGTSSETALGAARSYLKALHTRDYREAYNLISAADRLMLDQPSYLQGQIERRGFAMELARQLAADMEIRVIEIETQKDRARLTVEYKVPADDELSSLLYSWDEAKLNALSRAEQQRIINLLDSMRKSRDLITTGGRETLNLVREGRDWKIFLNWAAAVKVSFAASVPRDNAIQVEVLRRTVFASPDEPFQTGLKLRNPGQHPFIARITHRVEPTEFSDRLAMIACGFLRPLTLNPGEEREVSSAYLLDSGFPKNTPLAITFEFSLSESAPSANTREKQRSSDTL
ncbi:MAG TPA: cytochrome c oxidase assembly protein [Candidatus Binatia bacterium]|nr:cytochrome c oxidase assembly protein [Candidatus Binatia bacterium]